MPNTPADFVLDDSKLFADFAGTYPIAPVDEAVLKEALDTLFGKERHLGPGPHPSGAPQSVHGKKGGDLGARLAVSVWGDNDEKPLYESESLNVHKKGLYFVVFCGKDKQMDLFSELDDARAYVDKLVSARQRARKLSDGFATFDKGELGVMWEGEPSTATKVFGKSKLSGTERAALADYAGSFYKTINNTLCTYTDDIEGDWRIEGIDRAMTEAKLSTAIMVVRRKEMGSRQTKILSKTKVGDAYIGRGYESTSANIDWGIDAPLRVFYHLPKNAKAIYLEGQISLTIPGEYEVLLDRDLAWKVASNEVVGVTREVHLDYVGKAPPGLERHLGPGPHPSGSPQSIHGKKGEAQTKSDEFGTIMWEGKEVPRLRNWALAEILRGRHGDITDIMYAVVDVRGDQSNPMIITPVDTAEQGKALMRLMARKWDEVTASADGLQVYDRYALRTMPEAKRRDLFSKINLTGVEQLALENYCGSSYVAINEYLAMDRQGTWREGLKETVRDLEKAVGDSTIREGLVCVRVKNKNSHFAEAMRNTKEGGIYTSKTLESTSADALYVNTVFDEDMLCRVYYHAPKGATGLYVPHYVDSYIAKREQEVLFPVGSAWRMASKKYFDHGGLEVHLTYVGREEQGKKRHYAGPTGHGPHPGGTPQSVHAHVSGEFVPKEVPLEGIPGAHYDAEVCGPYAVVKEVYLSGNYELTEFQVRSVKTGRLVIGGTTYSSALNAKQAVLGLIDLGKRIRQSGGEFSSHLVNDLENMDTSGLWKYFGHVTLTLDEDRTILDYCTDGYAAVNMTLRGRAFAGQDLQQEWDRVELIDKALNKASLPEPLIAVRTKPPGSEDARYCAQAPVGAEYHNDGYMSASARLDFQNVECGVRMFFHAPKGVKALYVNNSLEPDYPWENEVLFARDMSWRMVSKGVSEDGKFDEVHFEYIGVKKAEKQRHLGPGPHPSGSPQSVHGKKGPQESQEFKETLLSSTDWMMYDKKQAYVLGRYAIVDEGIVNPSFYIRNSKTGDRVQDTSSKTLNEAKARVIELLKLPDELADQTDGFKVYLGGDIESMSQSEKEQAFGRVPPTVDQENAIMFYGGHGYLDINRALCQGSTSGVKKEVEALDQLMDASCIPASIMAVRFKDHESNDMKFFRKAKVGDEYHTRTYLSSSARLDYAPARNGVRMFLHVPLGAKAIFMNNEAGMMAAWEDELLFARDTSWRVKSLDSSSSDYFIDVHLEYIGVQPEKQRHLGPGPHPGGSPQSVHGKKGEVAATEDFVTGQDKNGNTTYTLAHWTIYPSKHSTGFSVRDNRGAEPHAVGFDSIEDAKAGVRRMLEARQRTERLAAGYKVLDEYNLANMPDQQKDKIFGAPKVTDDERYSLLHYAGDGYESINSMLWLGAPSAQKNWDVQHIDAAMSKASIAQPVVTVRTKAMNSSTAKELLPAKVGYIHEVLGYESTSADIDYNSGMRLMRLYYHIPKGARAIYLNTVEASDMPEECEVLIDRNTSWRVVSNEKVDEVQEVHLEYVGKTEPAQQRHLGPGPHPSGSPQSVHGKEGQAKEVVPAKDEYREVTVPGRESVLGGDKVMALGNLGLGKLWARPGPCEVIDIRDNSTIYPSPFRGEEQAREAIDRLTAMRHRAEAQAGADYAVRDDYEINALGWQGRDATLGRPDLTDQELAALMAYSGDWYRPINAILGSQEGIPTIAEIKADPNGPKVYQDEWFKCIKHIGGIDSAMKKAFLGSSMLTVRAKNNISAQARIMSELKPGDIYTAKGYESTSASINFAAADPSAEYLRVFYKAPKGARAIYLPQVGATITDSEQEVLFVRGATWKVLSNEMVDGGKVREVFLEYKGVQEPAKKRHLGPGTHPSGTPQAVHGKEGQAQDEFRSISVRMMDENGYHDVDGIAVGNIAVVHPEAGTFEVVDARNGDMVGGGYISQEFAKKAALRLFSARKRIEEWAGQYAVRDFYELDLTDKQVAKVFGVPKIDSESQQALYDYSSSWYDGINDLLWNMTMSGDNTNPIRSADEIEKGMWKKEQNVQALDYIRRIDSAMSKASIGSDIVTVRVRDTYSRLDELMSRLKVGDTYTAVGYDSSSANINYLMQSSNYGTTGVRLVYKVPKGARAIYLRGVEATEVPEEEEVLFARGSSWKVDSNEMVGEVREVHLEYIGVQEPGSH